MLIKLRAWIIHKMGGYTKSELIKPKIEFTEYHPVIITADYRIRKSDYDKLAESVLDAESYAQKEVYVRLEAELHRNIEHLVEFRREENYHLDTYDYRAWLKVLVK